MKHQVVPAQSKELSKNYSVKQKLLLQHYFTKRKEGDLDLVNAVFELIRDEIGITYATNFINDIDIRTVKDKLPGVQRVIINKYLTIILLRFKGITNISILQPLFLITNEGTHDDWFQLVANYIVPFMKQFNVMETIYPTV